MFAWPATERALEWAHEQAMSHKTSRETFPVVTVKGNWLSAVAVQPAHAASTSASGFVCCIALPAAQHRQMLTLFSPSLLPSVLPSLPPRPPPTLSPHPPPGLLQTCGTRPRGWWMPRARCASELTCSAQDTICEVAAVESALASCRGPVAQLAFTRPAAEAPLRAVGWLRR